MAARLVAVNRNQDYETKRAAMQQVLKKRL